MNSNFLLNIFRFVLLLLVQIVVFDNIELWGYITPYPYVLFILLYPVNTNRYGFLIWSFLLGIIMDIFSNSGGIHAASCVMLSYFRHFVFKISYGLSYEHQTVKVSYSPLKEQLVFVGLSVWIHHLVLFLLEAFNLILIGSILLKTLLSGIFTTIFCLLIINGFKVSRK